MALDVGERAVQKWRRCRACAARDDSPDEHAIGRHHRDRAPPGVALHHAEDLDVRAGRTKIEDTALTADGKTLVTANGSSDDVSLIDRASGKVVRKLNVGKGPWGIAAKGETNGS